MGFLILSRRRICYLDEKFGKPYLDIISMNQDIEKLTAGSLRKLLIREMKKFIVALKYESTASDLEEIRDHIRELMTILTVKEQEETFSLSNHRE